MRERITKGEGERENEGEREGERGGEREGRERVVHVLVFYFE